MENITNIAPTTRDDYFIVNKETGKLELHFTKEYYQALDEDTRREIKSNFLWSRRAACWISRRKEPNLEPASRIANNLGLFDAGETGENMTGAQREDRAKVAVVDRDLLREQYGMAWHESPRMVDYCVNKAAAVAILPGGEIIVIDKQSIETRFCFGESGYDADEAAAAAQYARTSVDYFKRENMEHFNEMINDLNESMNDEGYKRLVIYTGGAYIGQDADCRLRNIGFARLNDIIDACGGSCYTSELPGKELTVHFQKCRVATHEELSIILEAYKAARQAHEKKVDAYLKRYGLTKVHAWTYWRDA